MDAKTEKLAESNQFADIWSPHEPLPTQGVLKKLIERICSLWGESELAEKIRPVYNMRLSTTLGRASYNDMRIELNPKLLAAHPDELISTLAHELAHLAVFSRYGRDTQPHGLEFRAMMRSLSLSSRATHDLPVEHLRKKRRAKYVYLHRCSQCGYKFVAKSMRKNYYCLACGPEMTWDVFKIPNTPSGKKLLKHLEK